MFVSHRHGIIMKRRVRRQPAGLPSGAGLSRGRRLLSWLDQLADHVEDLRRAGFLQQNGRSAEALPILDKVLDATTDSTTRGYALVQRLGVFINLGRVADLATGMTAAPAPVYEGEHPQV